MYLNVSGSYILLLSFSNLGPCDTLMTDELAECSVLDDELHNYFQSSKEENKLVQVADTAKKLIRILSSDTYDSGCHIDYYDDL